MDVAILKASRYQLSPWYNWNIVQSGVKYHKPQLSRDV
jgi:hypothetical protein